MVSHVDDYPHEVSDALDFNESMYFEFHDPRSDIRGFVRLANRPNEGRGERTVCLYLPDGHLAFGFMRPAVTSNAVMAAGGLAIEVVRPMEELVVRYDGDVHVLADPLAMLDPGAALSVSPKASCRIALQYRAMAPAHEQTFESAEGGSFAPNHYEQLAVVTGEVAVGERRFAVSGHGLRDHSWGPRSWQAPWFYRWLHGSGDDFGFMAAYFGEPDGSTRMGGFVYHGRRLHGCDDVRISTSRVADDFPGAVDLEMRCGDRRWQLRGEVVAAVPLRHRGADGHPSTRIVESAMRWRIVTGDQGDGGVTVYGMAEYLDQMVQGRPVGIRV